MALSTSNAGGRFKTSSTYPNDFDLAFAEPSPSSATTVQLARAARPWLDLWLAQHSSRLPSKDEVQSLAVLTGASSAQITAWMKPQQNTVLTPPPPPPSLPSTKQLSAITTSTNLRSSLPPQMPRLPLALSVPRPATSRRRRSSQQNITNLRMHAPLRPHLPAYPQRRLGAARACELRGVGVPGTALLWRAEPAREAARPPARLPRRCCGAGAGRAPPAHAAGDAAAVRVLWGPFGELG